MKTRSIQPFRMAGGRCHHIGYCRITRSAFSPLLPMQSRADTAMSIVGGPQVYVANSYSEIGSVADLPQNRSGGSPRGSPSGEAGWFDPAPGRRMQASTYVIS